jgi:hypothetical protein
MPVNACEREREEKISQAANFMEILTIKWMYCAHVIVSCRIYVIHFNRMACIFACSLFLSLSRSLAPSAYSLISSFCCVYLFHNAVKAREI